MSDLSDLQQLDWSAFWRVAPKDLDPVETREWLEALNSVIESARITPLRKRKSKGKGCRGV